MSETHQNTYFTQITHSKRSTLQYSPTFDHLYGYIRFSHPFISLISHFTPKPHFTDLLIEVLEISNGDAQGICEAQEDILSDCFRNKVSIRETAELIANQ